MDQIVGVSLSNRVQDRRFVEMLQPTYVLGQIEIRGIGVDHVLAAYGQRVTAGLQVNLDELVVGGGRQGGTGGRCESMGVHKPNTVVHRAVHLLVIGVLNLKQNSNKLTKLNDTLSLGVPLTFLNECT